MASKPWQCQLLVCSIACLAVFVHSWSADVTGLGVRVSDRENLISSNKFSYDHAQLHWHTLLV